MAGISTFAALAVLTVPVIAQWPLAAQPASPVSDLLNAPAYERTFTNHLESGEAYRRGNTNELLLRLDWFSSPRVVQFSTVNSTGRVGWGLLSWPRSVKLGGRKQLEDSELDALRQAIAELPAPPPRPNPQRWLLVSGIRSNEWFTSIYDRRDVPPEVERLFDITGACIVWDVATVQSSAKSVARPGDWRPGYIHAFKTAAHAPAAVSGSDGRIQFWDLRQPPDQRTPDTEIFKGTGWHSSAVAVSTEGNSLVVNPPNGAPWICDGRTWKPQAEWVVPEPGSVHLADAWDGSLLALLANGELRSLDAATLQSLTGQDP